MKMYSPNFFKPDFTDNKNCFKNLTQNEQAVNNQQKVAFKVKEIKKVKILNSDLPKQKNFGKVVNERISKIRNYFYQMASNYFKEEVV